MDAVTKALISKVAPALADQLENAERLQIAFSEALTTAQQEAIRPLIQRGPGLFIDWSRSDKGKAALQEVVDKFIAG